MRFHAGECAFPACKCGESCEPQLHAGKAYSRIDLPFPPFICMFSTKPSRATAGQLESFPNPNMNWYYVDQGQPAGPVNDAQFEELVRSGKIQPATLVWRERAGGLAALSRGQGPVSILRPPARHRNRRRGRGKPGSRLRRVRQDVCGPGHDSSWRGLHLRQLQAGLHAKTDGRRKDQHR